ncbi:MAG: CPBP family intramembrane glutamic endopeptidase [Bacteroidales bacterium]
MEKQPFFEGKNRLIQILYLLLFIVGGVTIFSSLGQLVAMLAYGFDMTSVMNQHQVGYYRIIQSFSSIGTFAVPGLLFAYCSKRNWLSYNKMDKAPNYILADIVIVMSLIIIPVVVGFAQWNEEMALPEAWSKVEQWMRTMEENSQTIITLLTNDPRISILLLNLVVFAILPAFCEELLFRGTIQPFLADWTKNQHLAIWITAFIFSAIHLQFFGFIPRFLLGAYLGYLLFWSGSLWLPILAHFLHNTLTVIIQFVLMKKGFDVENMQPTDIKGFIPLFVTATIITALGVLLLWKKKKATLV